MNEWCRLLLLLLMLLVVLSPLPLGSNREWSWTLCALLASWFTLLWAVTRGWRRDELKQFVHPAIPLLLFLAAVRLGRCCRRQAGRRQAGSTRSGARPALSWGSRLPGMITAFRRKMAYTALTAPAELRPGVFPGFSTRRRAQSRPCDAGLDGRRRPGLRPVRADCFLE